MTDREKTQGENTGFKRRREHRANGTGDHADDDVINTHKHENSFVEHGGVASDDPPLLDRCAFAVFAQNFARTLRPGDAVALSGGLGAGKTTFVRAVVAELHGSDDAVSSPTFVFRQHYDGEPPIEHVDLYRLEDPSEAADLGLDEAFNAQWVTLVEWPERLPDLLPPDAVRVRIDGAGDVPRTIRVDRPNR